MSSSIQPAIFLFLPQEFPKAPAITYFPTMSYLTLIKQTSRNPFKGIGNPEPLKHALAEWWSRRINFEHRMVYRKKADSLELAQLCRNLNRNIRVRQAVRQMKILPDPCIYLLYIQPEFA